MATTKALQSRQLVLFPPMVFLLGMLLGACGDDATASLSSDPSSASAATTNEQAPSTTTAATTTATPTTTAAPTTTAPLPLTGRIATEQPSEYLGVDVATGFRQDLCNAASTRCSVAFLEYDRFTGDVDGISVNAGGLSISMLGVGWGASVSSFTGTVSGCPGEGTVDLQWFSEINPNGDGKNVATFEVIEGSGTGGLATLGGTGVANVTTDVAAGTLEGTLTADLAC